jgi:hypothetical protein
MGKPGTKQTEQNNLHYIGGYMDGDLTSIYKSLAEKYRIWIYNGQEDGCIVRLCFSLVHFLSLSLLI